MPSARSAAGSTLGLRAASAMAAAVALAGALAGCITRFADAPVQQLDRATGATVFHLSRPVQLVATVRRSESADPFAQLAPFVTDTMGSRGHFLWIAVPGDTPIEAGPQLECGGQSVPLVGRTGPPPGLEAPPYERPVPWSVQYYFDIDPAALLALGSCGELSVTVRYQAGTVRFEGDGGALLRAFLELTGPG